jgi:outer membrane protein assembly factor BamD (BamD/ComL family)
MKFKIFTLIVILSSLSQSIIYAQSKDQVEAIQQNLQYLVKQKNWNAASRFINNFEANYPSNPSELDVVKKYEVDQVKPKVEEALRNEDKLYQDIMRTLNKNLAEQYLDTYPYGRYTDEVRSKMNELSELEHWNQAKEANNTAAFYGYLDRYPNGKYSSEAKTKIDSWDDSAYNKAIADGSQNALNYYLNNYPRGKYRDIIRSKLSEQEEYDTYMYAKNHNYLEDYENYLRKYPNGKYASEVKRIIENAYYKFGNDAFDDKNYSKAKTYYETYLAKYPYGSYSSEVSRKIKNCERMLSQSGADFFMYTYDSISPIGLSIGSLYKSGSGYYLNLKINQQLFTSHLWEIDNLGMSDSPWDIIPTGESRQANISLSGGVTFRIVYPLWAYLGVGLGYYPQFDEVDEYTSSGDFYETVWMKNTDESSIGFSPEGGLNLKLGNVLVLKYGLLFRKGVVHQLGIGIQL